MINWYLFLIISIFVIIGEFSKEILAIVCTFSENFPLVFIKSQLETDIEREITEIKSKMDIISKFDEFAKYAKLERKLNALKEQLKTESKEGKELFDSMKYVIYMAVQLLWNAIGSYMIWNNFNTPLLHIDPSWLMPLNSLIGWPSDIPGDVGVLPWYLIVKNVTKYMRPKK